MFKKTNQKYCGTVSFAELASQNVVGYATKDVGYNGDGQGTALVLNPFLHVQNGESLTLGDFSVNQTWSDELWDCTGFLPGIDSIQILDGDGKFIATFTYYCKGKIENDLGLTATEGWYAMDDTGLTDCKNSYSIPYGAGVVVIAGKGNGVLPAITTSGEVKRTPTSLPLTPTTITGNVTPATITFGDITVNQIWDDAAWDCFGFQPAIDTLQTMNSAGQFNGEYTYYCQGKIDNDLGLTATAGWYAKSDSALANPVNNNTLEAGQAVVFVVGKGNGVTPTITVSSAIK